MKIFKRVLCFLLIIPVMLVCVGCGKDNGDSEKSNSNKKPKSVSTAEILEFAYEDFCDSASHEVEGTDSFSAKNEDEYIFEEYDAFALAGMSVLNGIADADELKEKTWQYSDAVVLEGKENYVNRIMKFYVERYDYDNFYNVKLYLMLGIEGFDFTENAKTYDLYAYDINYYAQIKAVSIEMMIEKSRNFEDLGMLNSNADCYVMSYSNGEMLFNTFRREGEFDIENVDEYNNRRFPVFKSLNFDANDNVINNRVDGFTAQTMNAIANTLKGYMTKLDEIYLMVTSEETLNATKNEVLFDKIDDYVNASKIADFMEN